MNARFAYHLGWRWCVGEEPHGIKPGPMNPILAHLNKIDVYDHPVGHHCSGKKKLRDPVYEPQLGNPDFQAAFSQINEDYHVEVLKWIKESAAAGHKWVVPLDEPNRILPGKDELARVSLWKVLTAGGEGLDIYTAYEIGDYSDITVENFRRLDSIWDQMRHGIEFFMNPRLNGHLPKMTTRDGLINNGYCFTDPGVIYVVYSQKADGLVLDLSAVAGSFDIRWYDPSRGGELQTGSVAAIKGGRFQLLGTPPSHQLEWVALVKKVDTKPTFNGR